MRHTWAIKLAKIAFVLAAFYVALLYGWIWGYTFKTGIFTVGLIQAHIYAGIMVCIFLLTKKALWAKH